MSHIHIPDGVLPLWLVIVGWVAAAALVGLAVRRSSQLDLGRRVPLLGAVAAIMLVAMSSEIVPIAYHVNLTVVAGILLGPWLGVIAAALVVTILAFVGHGGVTVIGLNILMIAGEMVIGWALFRGLVRALGRQRTPWVAGVATALTLAISTTALVGLVWLGGSPAAQRESGAFDPGTLSFSNPFAQGVFTNTVLVPEAEEAEDAPLAIGRFAAMVYVLGSIGWVLEALITGLIVGLLVRVRPQLVFDEAPPAGASPPPGDHAVRG